MIEPKVLMTVAEFTELLGLPENWEGVHGLTQVTSAEFAMGLVVLAAKGNEQAVNILVGLVVKEYDPEYFKQQLENR